MVLAEATGFEPAISALTGLHVRPLHHASSNETKVTIPDWGASNEMLNQSGNAFSIPDFVAKSKRSSLRTCCHRGDVADSEGPKVMNLADTFVGA